MSDIYLDSEPIYTESVDEKILYGSPAEEELEKNPTSKLSEAIMKGAMKRLNIRSDNDPSKL